MSDSSLADSDSRPLIVHLVYRLDTGGLENGIVNLINHMPKTDYRHAVIALTGISEFHRRVERDDVMFISLNKRPGHAFWLYPRLYRTFRRLRPAIVHTRNLAALEAVVPAWLARVPVRLHGEHGRDVGDLQGESRKYQFIRKVYRPFVNHFVALSQDLVDYLVHRIHVPSDRVTQVYNGVDSTRFYPAHKASRRSIADCPFNEEKLWLIGTVGRMQIVKDQTTLARAFIELIRRRPDFRRTARLIMIGEGPLRSHSRALLESAGLGSLAWLPGERKDVPDIMRGLDCFVLPSLAEGISNTILEAMASALPVIATDVGGNADLVVAGETGEIVPSADPAAIARYLSAWIDAPDRAREMGRAGRRVIESRFNMSAMVRAYQALYDRQLGLVLPSSGGILENHVRNNRHL